MTGNGIVVLSRILLAGIFAATIASTQAVAGERILVFGFDLLDTSGEGVKPDHDRWLQAASERLTAELRDAGHEVSGPAGPRPGGVPIRSCNGCERAIAAEAGADIAATGTVHKVSTLVLSVTIALRDVASGEAVAWTAGIRGDNERSWLRGVDWLAEHRVLPHVGNSAAGRDAKVSRP